MAFQDLDACMYEILKDTLAYLDTDPDAIDEMSRKAFIYYNDLQKGKVQTK